MSEFEYTETEQQLNYVLNHQSEELNSVKGPDMAVTEACIPESEALLRELGISIEDLPRVVNPTPRRVMVVPSQEELCNKTEQEVGLTTDLESLFTNEELRMNQNTLRLLNADYNNIYKFGKMDITTCAAANTLGAVADILLIRVPQKAPEGLKGGPLSNYIKDWSNQRFPEGEMKKLTNSKVDRVSFDAQDNRHITEHVTGLSAYYHRLLSLGHDLILGLIFRIYDILNGKITAIDKTGKIVSQVMESYANREESNVFSTIAKQVIHSKSGTTTSMGLPAPLMGLSNLLQFGSIEEEEQMIAEIVQRMYYEGYDFTHFCNMSIPTMTTGVIIRLGCGIKRTKEDNTVKDSTPFSLDREEHLKLNTMLFIGHFAATAVNAEEVHLTQNPMAVGYPQWIAFVKYSYKQLKQVLLEKPELKDAYVRGIIAGELDEVYAEIDNTFEKISEKYIVIFNQNNPPGHHGQEGFVHLWDLCIYINADAGSQFDGDAVIPDGDLLDPASHQRFTKFSKEGGLL